MVNGLEQFQTWFEEYSDQFVLIGGTAASLTLAELGLTFRQTKDYDIVLHLEALTPEFGKQFWKFVEAGGYQLCQSDSSVKPKLHRFAKPKTQHFPYMLELFSRAPSGITLFDNSRLTPIPMEEKVSSLSAILLEDVYYEFLMSGRRIHNGLPWVGEDRLIPLKALAWNVLTKQKAAGEKIDSKNISKHLKDIFMLAGLLRPATEIQVDQKIAKDLRDFISAVSQPNVMGNDPRAITILENIARAYGLGITERSL